MKFIRILSLLIITFATQQIFAFENLFYTWRGFPSNISEGTKAIEEIKTHAKQITYLSSQAYHIDAKGMLYGSLNSEMVAIAKSAGIKLMPLIGNTDFDRATVHQFLHNPAAEQRAVQSILNLCISQQFAGVQIDFEGMSYLDKDAFSQFYIMVANTLHQHGFKVSAAIIPILSDEPPASGYLKSRYTGWSGCYDYKILGKYSDFITLMTYDQHGSITTPGPMDGNSWNETILQYALKYIPANKLSLGVPLHSGYWYTDQVDGHTHPVSETTLYQDAMRLIKDNHAELKWEPTEQVHYTMYVHNYLYEYLFLEDAASYQAKIALVNKYHLRGLSNWCIGEEDPAIWKYITA